MPEQQSHYLSRSTYWYVIVINQISNIPEYRMALANIIECRAILVCTGKYDG